METTIKTTYKGIAVSYDEQGNRWEFTLRGKDRYATTLKLAKEAIDKPPPEDKRPFTPIEVYVSESYGPSYRRAVVTSLAPSKYSYGRYEAWVTYKPDSHRGSKREKVALDKLYAVNPENDKIIQLITKNFKDQETLSDMEGKLKKKMQGANIKPEDHD